MSYIITLCLCRKLLHCVAAWLLWLLHICVHIATALPQHHVVAITFYSALCHKYCNKVAFCYVNYITIFLNSSSLF